VKPHGEVARPPSRAAELTPRSALDYLNLAAYKFVRIEANELDLLKQRLKTECVEADFRGTILLSCEGINVSLAGAVGPLEGFCRRLATDPRFSDLAYKRTWSSHRPFNRMLVRIKQEIIAFGVPGVRPEEDPAPYIEPTDLQAWLDRDRDVTLLDTRNRYEIELGTFRGARDLDLRTFRSFPDALGKLDALDPEKPVVTFCTGGIRCEKAAPLLAQRGFREVYQLRGGILDYFAECGGKHYEGECFVYDRRVALDASLRETATAQCYRCLQPVRVEEQALESYVPGESCPRCVDRARAAPTPDTPTTLGAPRKRREGPAP